jgi:hypothetical protein
MKKSSKPNPAAIKRGRRKSAGKMAELLNAWMRDPELPEHGTSSKLYFNGKLVASANAHLRAATNQLINPKKSQNGN